MSEKGPGEPMLKGVLLGIVLGVAGIAACVYLYFAMGHAPVAVTEADMPFERTFARLGLHSYLDRLPHPEPQVPADEKNLVEGAKVYKEHCAVCHGLPDTQKTMIAQGMSPKPPQLFKGTGVTDDEPWESYWKVEGGIRMTGMPGFKDRLTESQIWQVAQLVKNADKITPAVKAELTERPAPVAIPETVDHKAPAATKK
jgi:thiosulfate dehydrogenase